MPELPEVENVRRGLRTLVKGRTLSRVDVLLPRLIRRPDVDTFARTLEGKTIRDVERRGKYLLFALSACTLVSHLRMEGRYGLYEPDDPVEAHTHVIFHFRDGMQLRYRDVRQFGTFDLPPTNEVHLLAGLRDLGPEPLGRSLTRARWIDMLMSRRTRLKALLLDQTFVAGLGNIYVDEILYAARLHPERQADELTEVAAGRLYREMRRVLRAAVEAGGSSIKSYVNGYGNEGSYQFLLKVYGRKNQPCLRCGTPIEKIRVAGRGTHFCPRCQTRPRDV